MDRINEIAREQEAFEGLCEIVRRLRAPDGCPWDRESTPAKLRKDLLEETYECVEAIDEGDPEHIKEEIGDLYLLCTMLSYIHQEEGKFSIADPLTRVSEKLVRRHPHVFGDVKVRDSAEVLENWARIKVEQEGRKPKDSILDEVSRSLPPLDRAYGLQKKAAKAGFDWNDLRGVLAKIKEELAETEELLPPGGEKPQGAGPELEGELGDLLFAVVNLCRFVKVEPSVALQRTNAKFVRRFSHVEKRMKETAQEMKQENLDIMEEYWAEAKGLEAKNLEAPAH